MLKQFVLSILRNSEPFCRQTDMAEGNGESSLVLKTSLKEVWKKQRVFETPSVSISGVLTPIEGLEKFRQELTYAIFPNGKITPDVS